MAKINKSLIVFLLFYCYIIFVSILFSFNTVHALAMNGNISAKSYVLMDENSGRVLFEKNMNQRLPMASTTKLMTAIVVIEEAKNLNEIIQVDDNSIGVEGSSIYLKKGEKFKVKDLLYGLILASGNDASVALAYYVGNGNYNNFINKMNRKAGELKLKNTHFTSTHGLDDKEHYSSSYDLAKIMQYGLKNPTFKEIVSTKTRMIKNSTNSDESIRYLKNKVRPIFTYEHCKGGKTGFTDNAGRCMVSYSSKDNFNLICVVLNAPNMFEDSINLYNKSYNNFTNMILIENYQYLDEIPIENGNLEVVKVYCKKGFSYPLKKDEIGQISIKKSLPEHLEAPLKKNEKIGKIEVYLKNHLLFSTNVYNIDSVENVEITYKIKEIIEKWFYI